MEHTNKISGADNILATVAVISFSTIITSIFALLFGLIKEILPAGESAATYSYYDYFFSCGCTDAATAQAALTGIAIGLPLLILSMWYMHKRYQDDLTLWNTPLQRVYLHGILFVSVLIALSSLISHIYELIGGVYSWAALLNVVSTLIIAGYMFAYAWHRIHFAYTDRERYTRVSQYFTGGLVAIISIIVIGYTAIVGSPAQLAKEVSDDDRIYDLYVIQGAVISEYQSTGSIPEQITNLNNFYGATNDKVTNAPYEYTVISQDDLTFEVCATFETAFTSKKTTPVTSDDTGSAYWNHPEGRHCYRETIDTKKYQLYPENNTGFDDEENSSDYDNFYFEDTLPYTDN